MTAAVPATQTLHPQALGLRVQASPLSAGSNNSKAIPTDPIKFRSNFYVSVQIGVVRLSNIHEIGLLCRPQLSSLTTIGIPDRKGWTIDSPGPGTR